MNNRADRRAALGLLASTVLLLSPYLFAWPTPLIYPISELGTDLPREVWPLAYWIKTSLAQTGELPLWRPYLLAGAPLIGHPVAPVGYLPNWLVLILPLALALNLLAVFHLWWAGLGLYLCLRWSMRVSPLAAFLPALLFAQAPKWIAHLSGGHWPTLAAIVWWPWAWLAFQQHQATSRWHWALWLGVALAAQALNHGTYVALSLLWLGALTVWDVIRTRRAGLRRALSVWPLAGVVALGLAAVQLWPLLELLPYTNRTGLTLAEATFGSLPPVLLLSVLFPSDLKFPEWFIYPGAGLLLLAAWSRAGGWTRREWRWLVVAGLGLWMSLGVNTPIYEALYRWVPGFSLFRNPTRWTLLTFFALCVLAATGLERWLNHAALDRRRVAWLSIAIGTLYLAASAIKRLAPAALPFDVLPTALAVFAAGLLLAWPASRWRYALLALVLVAELWWVAGTLIRPEPETNLAVANTLTARLQSAAERGERSLAPYEPVPPPALAAFHLRAADGYDPFQLSAYADLMRRAIGCDYAGYAVAVPATQASPEAARACPRLRPDRSLLALLNVRYVLLPDPYQWPDVQASLVVDGFYVYEVNGLGAAFGVEAGKVASPADCLDALQAVDVASTAVVEREPVSAEATAPPLVVARQERVNGEALTVRAARPGLLIRSEVWAPGWGATIDGRPVIVERVDCALQGVWLEAGEHTVVFEYAPQGYMLGRWVSVATALVVVGGGWMAARRRDHGAARS